MTGDETHLWIEWTRRKAAKTDDADAPESEADAQPGQYCWRCGQKRRDDRQNKPCMGFLPG